MSEWPKVKLKELMVIKNGKDHKALLDGEYPVYGSGGIMRYVNKYLYDKESVLLPRKGTLNNIQFATFPFWTVDTCYYTEVKNEKVLPYFLYLSICQLDIAALNTGSAVPSMTFDKYYSIEINLPPLPVQRRIAEILSRYDSLIENYQRQIKLLEEAAQRLYKEWFVDLHFPGHENTPIIDGIPQGWEKKTVGECLVFHGNGGWGKETSVGKNEYPGKVIRGTDIEDIKGGNFGGIPLRYHTENDIKKRTLKSFDIVFELSNGNINNIGRCLLIDDIILQNCGQNTICASFCKLLRPIDKIHAFTLFLEIQDMQTSGRMLPLKKQGANGINNFDFDGFLNHTLLVPSNNLMLESIASIMKRISIIIGQFALLTEARDRLLPKLMSGEIDIV